MYGFQQLAVALASGGPARHLDISLMQAAAAVMGPKVMEFAHHGYTPASPNAPAGTYPTKDGWIAITFVRESHFRSCAEAVGRPELADDPRFATFPDRLENLSAVVEALSAATAKKTTAEWMPIFEEHGVLASPIYDFGDWLAAPQVVATQGAPEIAVSDGITSPTPRTPGREPFDRPAPGVGDHTDAVLDEFQEAK
jgi:crotonobetainyl-CoA:carnitine CoA-transferase CaiB-like acyl-CoA transferase